MPACRQAAMSLCLAMCLGCYAGERELSLSLMGFSTGMLYPPAVDNRVILQFYSIGVWYGVKQRKMEACGGTLTLSITLHHKQILN